MAQETNTTYDALIRLIGNNPILVWFAGLGVLSGIFYTFYRVVNKLVGSGDNSTKAFEQAMEINRELREMKDDYKTMYEDVLEQLMAQTDLGKNTTRPLPLDDLDTDDKE